ncbi:hypothetical protein PGB90_001021 [Kerria lacca]
MPTRPSVLNVLFDYIEENKNKFINKLKIAVSIPSVSCDQAHRKDVIKMMTWMMDQLTALNVTAELHDIGLQEFSNGTTLKLPPVILGSLGNDHEKPTVCVYGHLDVQPAALSDGWNTDPFELVIKDGKMYGRGSTDDKGPAISWLHVVEAFKNTNSELPVNLKFCFEGMEESGSEGLDKLLISRKDTFFKDVDYVCISDNYWLGTSKPCITYGLRGLCYFFVEVTCASKDLHSGIYGGTINEAMSDLIALLNTLLDKDGEILIPGIMEDVEIISPEEQKMYSNIDFDIDAYKNELGSPQLLHDKKEDLLMARWRYPSLSIHGIEGGFSEPGSKTVIPRKVIGKFSIRLVPYQKPDKVENIVRDHLIKQWKLRGSSNSLKITMNGSSPAWKSNPLHPHYTAAAKAIKYVYKTDPDLTREGGSIPVAITFQDIIEKNVLLLPMGSCDDGAHSQNEKLNINNYIEGTKMMTAYLYEVGLLGKNNH